MNAKTWENKIKQTCQQAGTYKPYFDLVIEQLAQILETRDNALDQFHETHDKPVILYTNKGGYTNARKNPALQMLNECNQQALAYWRDLGLTPNGYKKLTGETIDEKKGGTFEAMLEKLEI